MQSAFQEKFAYTTAVRGLLGEGSVIWVKWAVLLFRHSAKSSVAQDVPLATPPTSRGSSEWALLTSRPKVFE